VEGEQDSGAAFDAALTANHAGGLGVRRGAHARRIDIRPLTPNPCDGTSPNLRRVNRSLKGRDISF
jgi:hypothetical protein